MTAHQTVSIVYQSSGTLGKTDPQCWRWLVNSSLVSTWPRVDDPWTSEPCTRDPYTRERMVQALQLIQQPEKRFRAREQVEPVFEGDAHTLRMDEITVAALSAPVDEAGPFEVGHQFPELFGHGSIRTILGCCASAVSLDRSLAWGGN